MSNSTLAAMEFAKKFKDDFKFTITQVIGLTNDDEVSKEFRPYKQMLWSSFFVTLRPNFHYRSYTLP